MDPYLDVVSKFLSSTERLSAARPIAAWIAQVSSWNRRVDLTAARNDDELVDLMLADAVALAEHLPEGGTVVDVGTGAGAPGLPLAALRPDLAVTLVEPLQKRVALLRMVTGGWRKQDIASVALHHGKGEDLVQKGETFAVALSRATLAPPKWLELGAQLAPAGEVVVMLAQHEAPALDGWTVVGDHRYRWPLTGAERRLVRYRAE